MATTTTARHGATAVRRHGRRQPFDRRELERRGWRTMLEYRENHERDEFGVLGSVTTQWHAEAEMTDAHGDVVAVTATGSNPPAAWRRLRVVVDANRRRTRSQEVARR